MRRLIRYGVILVAGLLAVAACSAGSSTTSTSSSASGKAPTNTTLTISNENGALWTCGFNPYAQPPVWAYPDNEQVLLHLSPR